MSAQLGRWRTRAGHIEVGIISPLERDSLSEAGAVLLRVTRKRGTGRR